MPTGITRRVPKCLFHFCGNAGIQYLPPALEELLCEFILPSFSLESLFFDNLFTDEAFYYFYDLHSYAIAFLWEIKEV
jgi:hypothetical protein